jgi:antitoxin YefM
MNAVTLKDAKLHLEQLVEKAIANAEPTIIVTVSGEQVVFLSLDEYNSWKETLYLLANPANAEHLRRSIAEAGGTGEGWVAHRFLQELPDDSWQDTRTRRTDAEKQAARERFESHLGEVDLGYATGVDNEQIDAELARAYADTHEAT